MISDDYPKILQKPSNSELLIFRHPTHATASPGTCPRESSVPWHEYCFFFARARSVIQPIYSRRAVIVPVKGHQLETHTPHPRRHNQGEVGRRGSVTGKLDQSPSDQYDDTLGQSECRSLALTQFSCFAFYMFRNTQGVP